MAQVVTPAGFEIYYQAGPKRLYRLRKATDSPLVEVVGGGTQYDWFEVPSMSNILDVLDSPLAWWGMTTGVAGMAKLSQEADADFSQAFWHAMQEDDVEYLVKLLQQHKLTTNDTVKIAQDRGTSVHGALEYWADHGTQPEPDVYPESERGYVQGLKSFLYDSKAVAVVSEVMVGSLEWGFAGRFDLVADIPEDAHVFVHRTEKGQGDKCEEIPAGRWLLDLKTSKYVYKKHHLQLAGYRMAYDEAYGEQVDYMGVVRVLPDGRYELKQSESTADDFQNLKVLYDVIQRTQGK